MQGYNPDFHGYHHAVAQHSGPWHDRASPSGSDDDVGYLQYPEPHKMEFGVDEDPNAALTSQSLNADGTPKRPMNAFMIFARRRRPQVAAENQSLRTGEVSKILSREWNGMSLSDKQFYLDQAKTLKDNFNQKYPDYVYRRRPNNSRKRRKPDPSPGLPADHASSSEPVDDYSASGEYSDTSPIEVADADDSRVSEQEARYASLPPEGSMYPTSQARATSYHPSDAPHRALGEARVPYISRPGRTTPDTGMVSSISSTSRASEHSAGYYHPYLPAQHHHHPQSTPYFPEPTSTAETWPGVRSDQNRSQTQSWSQSSQDLGGDNRHRGYQQAVSSHGWANTSGSEGMPSSSSSGPSTANFGFPTLTSPFYPPQSGAQEGFSSSSVQPVSIAPQPYGVVTPMPGNIPVSGRSYPSLQQPYSSSSSSTLASYQPQQRTVSHALPSGQPVSSYSQAQSTSAPPPAGSGGEPSQMRYWPRER